jgi:hypothetical protein
MWRLQHLGYEQWCCACARTTHGAQTHINGIGLVTQHIGHKLTAVVLGLWSDNKRTRTYSSGVGPVVRQHIEHEITTVVLGLWSDNTDHELTAVVLSLWSDNT